MTFLWIVTVVALVAASLAYRLARRTAKRLEQLSQMYWELKYQHGELRARMQRVAGGAGSPVPSVTPPEPPPADAFIPLTSLKR